MVVVTIVSVILVYAEHKNPPITARASFILRPPKGGGKNLLQQKKIRPLLRGRIFLLKRSSQCNDPNKLVDFKTFSSREMFLNSPFRGPEEQAPTLGLWGVIRQTFQRHIFFQIGIVKSFCLHLFYISWCNTRGFQRNDMVEWNILIPNIIESLDKS